MGEKEGGRNKQIGHSSLGAGMEQTEQGLGRSTLCFRPLCLCFQISHPGPKPWLRSWLSLSYSPAPDINALFPHHLSHLCPSLYSCCLVQKQVPLSPPAPRAYTLWAPIRGPCLPCSTNCLQQLEGVTSIPNSHHLGLTHSILPTEARFLPNFFTLLHLYQANSCSSFKT